jgi:hypothetical protein
VKIYMHVLDGRCGGLLGLEGIDVGHTLSDCAHRRRGRGHQRIVRALAR